MATAKAKATTKPMIQIDDLVREMTDEEYAEYLFTEENASKVPTAE